MATGWARSSTRSATNGASARTRRMCRPRKWRNGRRRCTAEDSREVRISAEVAALAPQKPGYRAAWPAVLGLIGLDYFSTIAYQPYIAAEGAGLLAPLATAALVLLTCLGVLPIYAYVAGNSP